MTNQAIILAGGKGSRLGHVDKGFLQYQGQYFVQRILSELHDFSKIAISTNSTNYSQFSQTLIKDTYLDIGAMGGLHSALSATSSEWTFVISVDQPLYSNQIHRYLAEFICSDYDVIIPKDHEGKLYPLCAYYKKSALSSINQLIAQNNYKVHALFDSLSVKIVDLSLCAFYHTKLLMNVNTSQELEKLPLIVAISGSKNSGKTTLLCQLVREFKKLNKSVATIKHTSHSYAFDEQGSDTFLHRQAGSNATAIFSPNSFMINQETPSPDFITMFAHYDVILLEGFKESSFPKVAVVREGVETPSMPNVIAQYGGSSSAIPCFQQGDISQLITFLISCNWSI